MKILYDYEEFLEEMRELTNTNKIREIDNNWKTTFDLLIKHYTIGKGKKHIIFFSGYHGAEVITVDFLIYLMKKVIEDEEYNEILEKYTLDFFPVVNPEGYIITTSAIRSFIARNEKVKLEKLGQEFYNAYKLDDFNEINRKKQGIDSDNVSIKEYQKIFQNVTYECIPDKYKELKENVKLLYNKYNIPKGTIVSWSANGNGIDLNANVKYNPSIEDIKNNKSLYMKLRYSNIDYSHPGPINCPYNKINNFKDEIENLYIQNFLENLYLKDDLIAILNFHSAGGVIDQRPSNIPKDLSDRNINLKKKTLNNYLFAKFYQSETFKDFYNPKDSRYKILTEESNVQTRNGLYRTLYPLDILVELSGMGGNPIGPYGDLTNNYNNILISNYNAVKKSIKYIELSNKISDSIYEKLSTNINMDDEEFIKEGYTEIDNEFDKIIKSIKVEKKEK